MPIESYMISLIHWLSSFLVNLHLADFPCTRPMHDAHKSANLTHRRFYFIVSVLLRTNFGIQAGY